jgi:hypothetical protein
MQKQEGFKEILLGLMWQDESDDGNTSDRKLQKKKKKKKKQDPIGTKVSILEGMKGGE